MQTNSTQATTPNVYHPSSQQVQACQACKGSKVETQQYNYRQLEVNSIKNLPFAHKVFMCELIGSDSIVHDCREPARHAMAKGYSGQRLLMDEQWLALHRALLNSAAR